MYQTAAMQDQPQKPPSFPNLPKSALFSRLEAFLPVMAEENKKLSEAVAAGQGDKHNIEVEEAEEQSNGDADDAMAGSDDKERKDGKAQVIEMNFALGMMDENDSDGEADADAADTEAQIKAATTAKVIGASAGSKQQEEESSFQMRIEKPSNKPRPVIQELN
ncbi:Proteasome activator complex subunit 3 [Phytophthora cinnamomi]|uniref:Proteasome activator complex subunit 3 n=1 Tax=Phytophthora cinnamomi TaxID=4785 RepID=UPI00355A46F4|nr:Proteasome activator complex subunit 3 [Phytophthora cinnamomi]